MGELFERVTPDRWLEWTGERLTTSVAGQVEVEHLHRYFVARHLARGLDVLDIASGEGYGAALLAQTARAVLGVDVDAASIEHAKAAYRLHNLRFERGCAQAIPAADQSADLVVSFETIEHFYDQVTFLAEIRRVLRPSGSLLISSPNRDIYSPLGAAPNPFHVRELSRDEFEQLLLKRFKHVSLLAQRPIVGSVIVTERRADAEGETLTFERRSEERFEASTGLDRPLYFLALASDAPLAAAPESFYFERGSVDDLMVNLPALRAALAKQDALVGEKTDQLNVRDTKLQEKDAELLEKDAELRDKNSKLRESEAELRDKEAELRDKEAELRDKDSELRETENELHKLKRITSSMSLVIDNKNETICEYSETIEKKDQELMILQENESLRKASIFYKLFREIMRIERQVRELPRRLGQRFKKLDGVPDFDQTEIAQPQPPQTESKAAMRAALTVRMEGFLASGAELRLPSHPRPDVSILLILHNQAELTFGCLASIAESLGASEVSVEVIILDNLSTDSTGELLSRISGAKIIRSPENLHFLRGVNLAAQGAVGRHLLLLNNDAQLYPGSVESALRTLEREADVGAVGARIITPDGRLQEAGSIVWSDGSCAGYARGADPLDPVAMFRRDVDYCSGAFLLTRRDLFEDLGRFAEAYAPAYYEETDYCLRLWEAGFRVVYEPDAVILHYEFGSSAQAADAITLQQRNQLTLQTRHRDWLAGQLPNRPENVLPARRRRAGAKRILMIEDRVPHEKLGSGYPRAGTILKELAARAEVTFFPMAGDKEYWPAVRRVVPANVEVMIEGARPSLASFLKERRGQFDAILICRPHNMEAFLEAGGADPGLTVGAQIIYDAEAIFATREVQRLACQGKPVPPAEADRLLREEIALAGHASQVIAVSPADQRLFQSHGFRTVRVLSHTFELDPTPTCFEDRPDILFVGAMHEDDSPNADSLRWFAREVLPSLRRKLREDLRLKVVGFNRVASIQALDGDALDLVGPVEDLRPHFAAARFLVAPTRYAAGIPHKLGQAAALGVPIVATDLLADQVGWVSGRDLLAATDAEAFADACARLFTDRSLWDRLRRSAMERCREAWSHEAFQAAVSQILESVGEQDEAPSRAPAEQRQALA